MASSPSLLAATKTALSMLCLSGLVSFSVAWDLEPAGGQLATACPNLDFNRSCNTGSCNSGGISYYWKFPLALNELGYKQKSVGWIKARQGVVGSTFAQKYKVKGRTDVYLLEVKSAAACCKLCKYWNQCKYYQFVKVGCGCDSSQCFLYGPYSAPICVGENHGVAPSVVGAKCQKAECQDDPHLTGAHGTKYDFNGVPKESYCLVTDRTMQINMEMAGYYDDRVMGSTAVLQNGEVVRTWIRELGIVWNAEEGEHWLRAVARSGAERERGRGFLERAELDGVLLPSLRLGETLEFPGGFSVALKALEKTGPYDVDHYNVKIAGLLDMDMRLRVANPLLQTEGEAYVHISVSFNTLNYTSAVHGILGQTFRPDHEERAAKYSQVTAKKLGPISADGIDGKGFLDGIAEDYVVSDVLATDCLYTAYGRPAPLSLPGVE